jgi:hypothetical protein
MPDGYAPLGVRGGLVKAAEKMDRIFKLARAQGIALSVAVYPWPGQLVHDTAESLQATTWRTWCEGKCKRFLNLFPPMFAQVQRCPRLFPGCWYERLFIFGDFHFNVHGNALIAERLATALSQHPVTKVPQKPAVIR